MKKGKYIRPSKMLMFGFNEMFPTEREILFNGDVMRPKSAFLSFRKTFTFLTLFKTLWR